MQRVTKSRIFIDKFSVVFFLGLSFWCFHNYHVSLIFESGNFFSHLSNVEREMCFRTEMGLYYSYYKRIVQAPSYLAGVESLMHDNLTEFPNTINTLNRFNLYPELALGGLYRLYSKIASSLNVKTKQCYTVERGNGKMPVHSCDGLGEPIFFYLEGIWFCAGLSAFSIFVYGTFISDCIFGGCLAILCFFFNHAECTRVQWAPPLRENFAYPFILLHCLLATAILSSSHSLVHKMSSWKKWSLSATTCVALLLWQFSQFFIAAEIVIFLFMYFIGNINRETFKLLIWSIAEGYVFAIAGLFGNEMLLTSYLSSFLIVSVSVLTLQRNANWHKFSIRSFFNLFFTCAFSIGIKMILSINGEDAHIFKMLLSKFNKDMRDFHTMMYTCSAEFRGLPWSSVWVMFRSHLIPLVAAALIFLSIFWLQRLSYCTVTFSSLKRFFASSPLAQDIPAWNIDLKKNLSEKEKNAASGNNSPSLRKFKVESHKIFSVLEPEFVYNISLLILFVAMAGSIMRLKLFLTPHMCILSSLIASRKIMYPVIGRRLTEINHCILIILVMTAVSIPGYQYVKDQHSFEGEYSNDSLEELIAWTKANTHENSVFAGSMPTMANLLLSTERPIVNHPHYENANLRLRTKNVYSIYSRKPLEEVYETLVNMGVDYVVVERAKCFDTRSDGCSLVDLWDVDDKKNRNGAALCYQLLLHDASPFYRIYENDDYVVLRVTYPSLELRRTLESAAE